MSCTIEGKQCTACCRAITLNHLTRRKLLRFYGRGDHVFILANWKPLSRRRAKKKNPYIFQTMGGKATAFYHCTKVTDQGCGVYADRPRVCRDYPLYGADRATLAQHYHDKGVKPEYHPACTEWPRIEAVQIEDAPSPLLALEGLVRGLEKATP